MIEKMLCHKCYLRTVSLLVMSIFIMSSCNSDGNKKQDQLVLDEVSDAESNLNELEKKDIVYDVDVFSKIVLPKKLLEISGLTMGAAQNDFYTVNDEKAILFQLNQEGEILSQIDFGKNADYEGIEKVGNSIFILKSNGKVIEFDLKTSEKIESYNNPLSLDNDTEGLGYDASTHSLLIACKGSPNIEDLPKLKKTKAVYAYDLKAKQLIEQPFVTIADEHIEQYMESTWKDNISKKKYKDKLDRTLTFSPSAIALNPVDRNFYLLSTVGKILLVSDRNSEIKSIYFLDDAAYIQPEGICFDDQGAMWISNEGKGAESNMLRISLEN